MSEKIEDGKTFLDSGTDSKEEKKNTAKQYYDDDDFDDNYEPKYNFAAMSLSELKDYIKENETNVKGKAVESCIVHVTKQILGDRYKDLIIKNGVVNDPVKKRCYFLAKGKKLKKSIGSILLYKLSKKSDLTDYKFYVVLYNYSSYIRKKEQEFENIREILKSHSVEVRLLEELVR